MGMKVGTNHTLETSLHYPQGEEIITVFGFVRKSRGEIVALFGVARGSG
jgi:hypothetical protein